jgi:hypothetical protein
VKIGRSFWGQGEVHTSCILGNVDVPFKILTISFKIDQTLGGLRQCMYTTVY